MFTRAGNADTMEFYNRLGVTKSAPEAEIKKAYYKLARTHHPDKGGDPEKFKDITKAYETLTDSEKRAAYDKYGEDGADAGASDDPFSSFGRKKDQGKRRQRTKDAVQNIKVTLEQLYAGYTKKMAITRQVIDKEKGVQDCHDCGGTGVKVEIIRAGPMVQEMRKTCDTCGGSGKDFYLKQEREVLEVHVQKGTLNEHKEIFREMADENPSKDTGDVLFVIKQQEHKVFKRKGADLFIERNVSLLEALTGFQMEVTHLDGRKLLIKTAPGDVLRPVTHLFDPMDEQDPKTEWEVIEDADVPDLETVAQSDNTNVEKLKKMAEMQLKKKGINVGVFVMDGKTANFKQCTREQALGAKKTKKGATMYIISDPEAKKGLRFMKVVKGEGMPTYKNPFIHGNLFLNLSIQFPKEIAPEVQAQMKEFLADKLPPPLHESKWTEETEGVEVHAITEMDPVVSFSENKINMAGAGDGNAYDDDGDRRMEGPEGRDCKQQ